MHTWVPSHVHLPCLCFQAIVNQVEHDLQLIGARVQRLGGPQGSARLAAALAAVRATASVERTAGTQDTESPESPTTTPAGMSRCAAGILHASCTAWSCGQVRQHEYYCASTSLQVSKPVTHQEGTAEPGRVQCSKSCACRWHHALQVSPLSKDALLCLTCFSC